MKEEKFERLSELNYWESLYYGKIKDSKITKKNNFLKLQFKKNFGKKIGLFTTSYANYLLWEKIFTKYLPKQKGLRVIEIGSAPGINLIKLKNMFGYEPYGIDFSESGVKINKELFSSFGVNPDNIILADFFSEEFHQRYRGFFDIVYSGGFIEHFGNTQEVIDKHINLLSENGIVIIDIPNLKGINLLLTRFLNKKNISIHNLEIMDKKVFLRLFNDRPVKKIFCEYYGTMNLGLINIENRPILRIFIFKYLQFFLNFMFRLLLGKGGFESKFFSPYLIFIGKKTG